MTNTAREYPEIEPPALQFHHIEGEEANIGADTLTPEEQLAADFSSWVVDTIHNYYDTAEDMGVEVDHDWELRYGRIKNPNFLEPESIVLSVISDYNGPGSEFMFYRVTMRDFDWSKETELAVTLTYDLVPSIDDEEDGDERVVTNVGISYGDISIQNFGSGENDDFIAGFNGALDSLKRLLDGEDYAIIDE